MYGTAMQQMLLIDDVL